MSVQKLERQTRGEISPLKVPPNLTRRLHYHNRITHNAEVHSACFPQFAIFNTQYLICNPCRHPDREPSRLAAPALPSRPTPSGSRPSPQTLLLKTFNLQRIFYRTMNGTSLARRTVSWTPQWWLGLLLVAIFWPLNWALPGMRTAYLFFPLWLGYILVVDALVLGRTGTSLWTRSKRDFFLLFVASNEACLDVPYDPLRPYCHHRR